MNVDPVVAPIDQIGAKRMSLRVDWLERRVERANISGVKSVNEFLDVRTVNLDQLARDIGVLFEFADPAFDFFRALIFRANYIADELRALLENSWNSFACQVVGILRHDHSFQMLSEPAHRAGFLAILNPIAERGQLDQPPHRERIPVRRAEL